MVEEEVVVTLKTGLQARPAALFVQEANRFRSEITITKDGRRVNAKSIMGVMSLAVARGQAVILGADGDDQEEAIEALKQMISE
ncbi:HPr family phosphocarrier protein [Rubeoparvulum massiliense]|uniref:HPr family phosphocarrier protein n=1 Tax=Rubeoparvulum massiliense TaxID=1631346 RepID=UPI00065E66B4|nr:HPr family phosphocarrier protein [Rubeoparvulum massiliense]